MSDKKPTGKNALVPAAGTGLAYTKRPSSAMMKAAAGGQAPSTSLRKPGEDGRLVKVAQRQVTRTSSENFHAVLWFDATESRRDFWENATKQQTQIIQMLQSDFGGRAKISVGYHSGGSYDWLGTFNDGVRASSAMKQVQCSTGLTQFTSGINLISDRTAQEKPDVLILIGDAFEDDLHSTVQATKSLGVPTFCLHDDIGRKERGWGDRNHYYDQIFQQFTTIANENGGAAARLGENPAALRAFIRGICAIVGQTPALRTLANTGAVRELLQNNPKLLALMPPKGGNYGPSDPEA